MAKKSIIFLCTGNSCRSHIGEALARQIAGDLFDVYSAGTAPAGYIHPLAVAALAEHGISVTGHRSKHLDEFGDRRFEYVVTVCSHAESRCPNLRGTVETLRWHVDDPAALADDPEAAMAQARRVRDVLAARIRELAERVPAGASESPTRRAQ
jgi:arsenate reductase